LTFTQFQRNLPPYFRSSITDFKALQEATLSSVKHKSLRIELFGLWSNAHIKFLLEFGSNPILRGFLSSHLRTEIHPEDIVDLSFHAVQHKSLVLLRHLANNSDKQFMRLVRNEITRGYDTLLTCAIACSSLECISYLTKVGSDVNAVVGGSVSPLLVAVWRGDAEILDYLIHTCNATIILNGVSIDTITSADSVYLPPNSKTYLQSIAKVR
jgi:hypothetical protein